MSPHLEGSPLRAGQWMGSAGCLPAACTRPCGQDRQEEQRGQPGVLTVLEMALPWLRARAGGERGWPRVPGLSCPWQGWDRWPYPDVCTPMPALEPPGSCVAASGHGAALAPCCTGRWGREVSGAPLTPGSRASVFQGRWLCRWHGVGELGLAVDSKEATSLVPISCPPLPAVGGLVLSVCLSVRPGSGAG